MDDDAALERLLFPHEGRPVEEPTGAGLGRRPCGAEAQARDADAALAGVPGAAPGRRAVQPVLRSHTALAAGYAPVTMRQEHRAGEKAFVDFSGDGIDIVDPKTGEVSRGQAVRRGARARAA